MADLLLGAGQYKWGLPEPTHPFGGKHRSGKPKIITYSGAGIPDLSGETYSDEIYDDEFYLRTDIFQRYDGKNILGWTMDPSSVDIVYTNGQKVKKPNTNITLYPLFGTATATFTDGSDSYNQVVPYGSRARLRTDIFRSKTDGTYTYPLAGWSTARTKYSIDFADGESVVAKSDITLYPMFTAKITYSGNNREITEGIQYITEFILGSTITLRTDIFRTLYNQAPIRGWSTTKQNDITVVVPVEHTDGKTFTPSSSFTLYPLYTATKVAFSNASSITWTETISKQLFYNAATKTITSACHTVFSTYCEPLIRVVFDASAQTADQNKQFDVGIFVTDYGTSDIFVTSTRKQSATTVTGKEHDFTGSKEAYSMAYGAGGAKQSITGTAKITPTHFYVM